MGQPFASGKKAFGYCQNCGFRYDLKRLRFQVVKQKITSLMLCPECWSPDHPQLMLGQTPVYDPQAIRNARPESTLIQSRDTQWGWNPVGGGSASSGTPNNLTATAAVGTVNVTV